MKKSVFAVLALAISQTLTTPAYAAEANFVPYVKFANGAIASIDINNIEKPLEDFVHV